MGLFYSKSSSLEWSWPVCATSWPLTHGGIISISLGMVKVLGILQMLELSNHWADSLQMKFFGTILAWRCATSWSFAHPDIMGVGILFAGPHSSPNLSLDHWLVVQKISFINIYIYMYIDGLVQESLNSIAKALELYFSCTSPSVSYTEPICWTDNTELLIG